MLTAGFVFNDGVYYVQWLFIIYIYLYTYVFWYASYKRAIDIKKIKLLVPNPTRKAMVFMYQTIH